MAEYNLLDHNTSAPDFYIIDTSEDVSSNTLQSLVAYIEAMKDLSRVVLIEHDSGNITFSSHPDSIEPEVTK